jgi:hypothetical protein
MANVPHSLIPSLTLLSFHFNHRHPFLFLSRLPLPLLLPSLIIPFFYFLRISKYRQPSFATVLQRALLYTYITTCFG